jgi:ATP-dependent DNA helicase PIF1
MKTIREQPLRDGLARLVDMGGTFAAVVLTGGKVTAQVVHTDPDVAWAAVMAGKGSVAGHKPVARGEQVEKVADGPYGPVADLVEKGSGAIYLTGRAGSGKTTFLKGFLASTDMKAAVVAPSGIAALNAGGQTIHSLFKLPPALIQPSDVRRVREGRLLAALDLLIIDEISMVRSDMLDAIDRSMRLHRKVNAPFGGVRLLCVGDSAQLPPVVNADDGPILERWFGGPYFFDAPAAASVDWKAIELTRVFRQSEARFLELLDRLRRGRPTIADAELLDARVVDEVPEAQGDSIVLTTTNDAARRINDAAMARLTGQARTFNSSVEGTFDERLFPTDGALELRIGARVMLLRNDADRRWVNGTIGVVEGWGEDGVMVKIGRRVHEIEPVAWERYAYDLGVDGEPERKVVGAFRQVPLRPAWALTIHKAQGLTFDRVHVDLGRGAFAHGQTYVALSRCRTLEGLTLSRHLRRADVKVEDGAFAFLDRFVFEDHDAWRVGVMG